MQQVPTRSSVTKACRRVAVGAATAIAVVGSLAATTAVNAANSPAGAVAYSPIQPKAVITPKLSSTPFTVPTMKVQVGTTALLSATSSTRSIEAYALWTTSDGGPAVRSDVLAHKFDQVGLVRVTLTIQDYYESATTYGYVEVTEDPPANAPELTLSPSTDLTVTVGQRMTFTTRDEGSVTTTALPDAAPSLTQTWWTSDGVSKQGGEDFYRSFDRAGVYYLTVQKGYSPGPATAKTVKVTAVNRDGSHAPEIKFAPQERQIVNVGDPVRFDASPTIDVDGGGLKFDWSVEDSVTPTTATAQRPAADSGSRTFTTSFNEPGWKVVTLRVADAQGNTTFANQYVLVKAANDHVPVARVSPDGDVTVGQGAFVLFDGSASSDPDSEYLEYEWFADDGLDQWIEPTAPINFGVLGKRRVLLRVTDRDGNIDDHLVMVNVVKNLAPLNNFTGPSSAKAGEKVTYDASKSSDPEGGALTYAWLVNGEPVAGGTGKVLNYQFPKAGSYKVELRVTDSLQATTARTLQVEVTAENVAPVADFTVPTNIEAGKQVSFDGSKSRDPDNDPLTYAWRVRYASGVVSTKPVLDYPFPKAGVYGVELTVTDPSGASSKKWVEVKVSSINKPPVANFTGPKTATAGQVTKFDGSSSTDPDNDALTYAWRVRYASGVVSTKPVLDYPFPKAGVYGVELTVTDPSGASSKKWVEVKVSSINKPPVANFTGPKTATAGQVTKFDGSSSTDPDNDALTYAWYVRGEKGVVSTDKVLNYPFPKAGSYGVELRVTDPSGATSKKWMGVAVK